MDLHLALTDTAIIADNERQAVKIARLETELAEERCRCASLSRQLAFAESNYQAAKACANAIQSFNMTRRNTK